MIKLLIASGVAATASALALPAYSNVYLNPEFNGANYGDDYLGGTLTIDVGYAGLMALTATTSREVRPW